MKLFIWYGAMVKKHFWADFMLLTRLYVATYYGLGGALFPLPQHLVMTLLGHRRTVDTITHLQWGHHSSLLFLLVVGTSLFLFDPDWICRRRLSIFTLLWGDVWITVHLRDRCSVLVCRLQCTFNECPVSTAVFRVMFTMVMLHC
jgi:hypothetical protein